MYSMTGYASLEGRTGRFSYTVEIKSLNSKFLETYVNLPRVLRAEEQEIQKKVSRALLRGKVEVSIDIVRWHESRPVSINGELLSRYYQELKELAGSLGSNPPSLDSLLGLDGVTQKEKIAIDKESVQAVMKTVDQALAKVTEMRKSEGKATREDILASVKSIDEMAREIKSLSRGLAAQKADTLRKRLESLGVKEEDPRIYNEVVIMADRLDINEELVRLKDHVRKFRAVVKEKDQIGRKLDFISQEIFREINTITSKSNSSAIAHLVVDMKNHVDKIREQCRNVV